MAKVIIDGTADDDAHTNDGANRLDASGYAIFGLAGNDVLVGSAFDDELDGGEGLDGVSYTDETANVNVNLATGIAFGDSIGNDTLMNIEIVDSGEGSDILVANDTGSILRGMGGHDVITGGLGSDALEGGTGNDELIGGGGDGDVLYGNDGLDYLTGGLGNDYLQGGQGVDVLNGGDGGTDDIASYTDELYGVNVNLLTGKSMGKTTGKDILINIDSVDGSDQADKLSGNNDANSLQAFGGNDIIKGLGGNDYLLGGDGSDHIIAGLGDDLLVGGAGDDILTGGKGDDSFLFDTALVGTGIDKITDFRPINDTIQLDSAIFTQLTPDTFNVDNFKVNEFLIYDKASGALSYDADGSGADAAVQIAVLGSHPALTFADFVVI